MSRFRSPRPRPTSEPASAPVPGPAEAVESVGPPSVESQSTATAAPSPTRRRLGRRPSPLPTPRPEAEPGVPDEHAPGAEDEDEYWEDEYDDEYEDDDEYWEDEYDDDAEYDDDEYWEDEYDDEYEDDDEGPEESDGGRAERRPRRLLPGRRSRKGRGRRLRRPVEQPVDAEHVDAEHPAGTAPLDGPTDEDDPAVVPRPRRRRAVPKVPVAAIRTGGARRVAGARSGLRRGYTSTRTGLGRGWAGTRKGTSSAVHFVRTHWGRTAYIYLGIVGIAMLVTILLYWRSGFTYDECNYCGMPALLTVSPWWLLILPFNVSQWPLLLPLVVLVLFAGLNAELVDRWSKRPEPEYPDWD
jgi:hypothetical protein